MIIGFNTIFAGQKFTSAPNITTTHNTPNIKLTNTLPKDTVSFGNNDLLNCSKEEITARIKETLRDSKMHYLGAGNSAEVFKISQSDYCVRIPYQNFDHTSNVPNIINLKSLKIRFNLSEQDKINHVVGKFKGGCIMKYIEGTPVLNPTMRKNHINEISKQIEEMPVESFHKLLQQICHAYQHNMMFDCSWNNVIVNPKNKTLTAIDFYNMDGFHEVSHPFSHIFASLTHSQTTPEQKKNFAGKILTAGLMEVEPEHKPCLDIRDFDYYRFIYKLQEQNLIQNPKYTNLLIKLFEEIECLKLRDLQGDDVSKTLNHKIKTVKCLIKQLL